VNSLDYILYVTGIGECGKYLIVMQSHEYNQSFNNIGYIVFEHFDQQILLSTSIVKLTKKTLSLMSTSLEYPDNPMS